MNLYFHFLILPCTWYSILDRSLPAGHQHALAPAQWQADRKTQDLTGQPAAHHFVHLSCAMAALTD